MCLNKTYIKVHKRTYLSDAFPILNNLNHGTALSPLLFNFLLELSIRGIKNKESLELNGIH
jgi:hypothetical protein